MPLRIRPATEADSFRIGCIGRDAFRDTVSRALFPPELYSKSPTGDPGLDEALWRAARNTRRLKEGKLTYVAIDDPQDGTTAEPEVVGYCQWELPCSEEQSNAGAPEVDRDPTPPTLDRERARAIMEMGERKIKEALGEEGHRDLWYLMILGVDPAHQRRGIGRMLVQHGLNLAREQGKAAFLIATPEGKGLYQSLGFEQVGDAYDVYGTVHCSMLWREPQAGSA